MSYLIKEMPESERPRERFKKYGVSSLSNEELLSILIRTGTDNKSVKELSMEVLKMINIHDFINQVRTNLLPKNYESFLKQ